MRTAVSGVLPCLVLSLGTAAAEAKKRNPKTFKDSVVVNAAIPDANAVASPSTPVVSQIKVPKRFKGKVVGDVNVTGIQTTGNLTDAADDLVVKLTAPNGRTVRLLQNLGGGGGGMANPSIGPLTLDDDTRISHCDNPSPNCSDPDRALTQPFAGTANLAFLGGGGSGPLSAFNGAPMRGTWTLKVYDQRDIGQVSLLNRWGLQIKRQKPISAKMSKGAKRFRKSLAVNAAIPDDPGMGPSTPISSQITVPKKFKGKVVGDLNVTGIQISGNVADAADDVTLKLTAPNGRTVQLFDGIGDASIGPLTLDDDTETSICDMAAACAWATNLPRPFAGTANLVFMEGGGLGPLSSFDGVPMRGTWTLTAFDGVSVGQTSVLNSWGLDIKRAKAGK